MLDEKGLTWPAAAGRSDLCAPAVWLLSDSAAQLEKSPAQEASLKAGREEDADPHASARYSKSSLWLKENEVTFMNYRFYWAVTH